MARSERSVHLGRGTVGGFGNRPSEVRVARRAGHVVRTRLGPDTDEVDAAEPADLRLVPAAVCVWLGVLAGLHAPLPYVAAIGAAAAVLGLVAIVSISGATARLAVAVALMALLAGLVVGSARAWLVHSGPVADLAAAGATVSVNGVVLTDPSV